MYEDRLKNDIEQKKFSSFLLLKFLENQTEKTKSQKTNEKWTNKRQPKYLKLVQRFLYETEVAEQSDNWNSMVWDLLLFVKIPDWSNEEAMQRELSFGYMAATRTEQSRSRGL